MTEKITSRRWLGSAAVTVLLALGLMVTTLAIALSVAERPDDIFSTGVIQLNLNDSQPVITEGEYLFEPGMTVKKDFFIRNESTWDVYYRIYFDNISGGLADVLDVTIKNGETVLYSGKPSELVRSSVPAAEDILAVGERRELTVYFYFPKEAGNEAQISDFEFTVCAEATQTKNNPDKKFD